MARIERTRESKRDYEGILDYIAADNPSAAEKLIRTFDSKLSDYAEQPRMGTLREEYGKDIRSFPVGNYIIYYRPIRDGIELIRVLHAHRDHRRIFDEM
jgi:toxin ParE1/3/4